MSAIMPVCEFIVRLGTRLRSSAQDLGREHFAELPGECVEGKWFQEAGDPASKTPTSASGEQIALLERQRDDLIPGRDGCSTVLWNM